MSQDLTFVQVTTAINKDQFSLAELDALARFACRAAASKREFANIGTSINAVAVGNTVKFNSKVRPTYLIGKRATVVKVNRTRVKVRFIDPLPGNRFAGLVNTSTTLFDVVSK